MSEILLFVHRNESLDVVSLFRYFNPLHTKRRPLYLKPSPYRAVNTFYLGYKNQSVYAVSGTSRCLFSDKHKTHKYSVGQSVQLFNVKLAVRHVTGRLQW